jgi:hypothetical protein
MATGNSVQMAKLLATPVQHVRSDEHGRVRRAWFEYPNDAAEALATGSTINLCKLPPGARVLGGKIFWEANAGTNTLAIGIAGATTKYAAAFSLTSASQVASVTVASGLELNGAAGGGTMAAPVIGEVQTGPITIIGTTAGTGPLTANKRICGWMEYLGVE